MVDSVDSFAAAVRAVLTTDKDRPDMRAVGRRALDLLGDDLIYEAAVTHLTGIARREWNNSVKAGDWAAHSDEVVNLRGTDVLLGDIDEDDRAWLARNREVLGAGLLRRASSLRNYDGGPGIRAAVSQVEVLAAERRADQLEAMATTLESITSGIGTGGSPVEARLRERAAADDRRRAQVEVDIEFYRSQAARLADCVFQGSAFARSRRAVRIMADAFDIEGVRGEG